MVIIVGLILALCNSRYQIKNVHVPLVLEQNYKKLELNKQILKICCTKKIFSISMLGSIRLASSWWEGPSWLRSIKNLTQKNSWTNLPKNESFKDLLDQKYWFVVLKNKKKLLRIKIIFVFLFIYWWKTAGNDWKLKICQNYLLS